MIFFTSDTHFGHSKVIEYCNRPFATAEEMDDELIKRWNEVVSPGDTVYHLGDFSFCGMERSREILNQLKGTKILIKGNHDRHFFRKDGSLKDLAFSEVMLNSEMQSYYFTAMMSHYPYLGETSDGRDFSAAQLKDEGKWLLHGHVHCEWKVRKRMINVGVDQWDFRPVSFDKIHEIIKGGTNDS